MQSSSKKLPQEVEQQILNDFIGTLATIDYPPKMANFLKEFFSENELLTYAKRLAVTQALKENKSYEEIQEKYQVSSATVASIGKK